MFVSFDKFDNLEQPQLILCNPGCKYSNGDTTRAIGEIPNVQALEFEYNFNALSTVQFRVYDEAFGYGQAATYNSEIFDAIQNHRYLFVPDIGYFIVTESNKVFSDGLRYKDVTAESAEKELQRVNIPYIEDGTYEIYNLDGDGILNVLARTYGYWIIGEVDEDLLEVSRTIEDVDVDQNVYDFLIETVQKLFECVFVFDILNRTINVYAQSNFVNKTSIHLTWADWVLSSTCKESGDDIYTALRVFGDGDIDISAVNPIGTGVIYNFTKYIPWMEPTFGAKVEAWQEAIAASESDYYLASREYYAHYDELNSANAEVDRLNGLLALYQKCRQNIVDSQSPTVVTSFNILIEQDGGTAVPYEQTVQAALTAVDGLISNTQSDISNAEAEVARIESYMNTYYVEMKNIRDTLAIDSYFTPLEYKELSCYIYEGQYTDSLINITDTMALDEKVDRMRKLMSNAQVELRSAVNGRVEYDVDTDSFVFDKKYEEWAGQLQTGCIITVETDKDDLSELFMTGLRVNYEERKGVPTFGNRLMKTNPKSLFKNTIDNIKRSANTILYV